MEIENAQIQKNNIALEGVHDPFKASGATPAGSLA
jgi:hypothetical protein